MKLDFPIPTAPGETHVLTNGITYQWDGEKWNSKLLPTYALVGANPGPTPPPGVPAGTFWWDTVSGQLFVLYADADSTQWVEASTTHPDLYNPAPPDVSLGDLTMFGPDNVTIGSDNTYSVSISGDAADLTYSWSTKYDGMTNIPSITSVGEFSGTAYEITDNDALTYVEMAGDSGDYFDITFSETITSPLSVNVLVSSGYEGREIDWFVKPNNDTTFQGTHSGTDTFWLNCGYFENINSVRIIKNSANDTIFRVHAIGFTDRDEGIELYSPDTVVNKTSQAATITFGNAKSNEVTCVVGSQLAIDAPKPISKSINAN